jgi:plastocyanin
MSGRRLLFVTPLVIAIIALGLFAPGLTSAFRLPDLPHVVGMVQVDYDRDTIILQTGDRLWLVNNSNFLHVVTLGYNSLIEHEPGAPHIGNALGLEVMPHGTRYETPPWNTPGTYHMTCTLHAHMNLTVVVMPAAPSHPAGA